MIDVPTRVKDALREGDRLKRYRFVVENMPQEVWTDVTDYQESTSAGRVTRTYSLSSGTYKFTAGEYALEVRYIESGSQIMVMVNPNSSKTITFDVNKSVNAIYRVGDDCLVQKQSFEDLIITNDNLVSETVTFDERMCSDKEIKFGLCEGTNLEFQYFGLPNITGKRLQAFIDVQYKDSDDVLKWHEIPMGWFEVSESSRQASTGIIKVSAFNKLQSDYLDNEANAQIEEIILQGEDGDSSVSMHTILDKLLDGYSIEKYTISHIDADWGVGTWSTPDYTQDNSVYKGSEYAYIHTFYTNITFEANILTWSMEKFYNFVFALQKIKEKILDTIPSSFYDYTVMAYSGDMSFYDFIHSNDPMAPRIGGEIWENFVNDPHAYLFQNLLIQADTVESGYHTNISNISTIGIMVPLWFTKDASPYHALTTAEKNQITAMKNQWEQDIGNFLDCYEMEVPEIELMRFSDFAGFSNVTLRDLQTAVYETVCQYGKLDRITDLFSGVELNNSRLLPAEDLYPANDLYPNSIAERSNPAMYSKLWADEGNVRKFRYLIITYKGTETEGGQTREVEKTLQRTVDENGTDDYNMSNNWLFKNLVWTDEEVGDYADAMVAKMQNLTWFPFEMWCAGLPYVETGDELEINVNGEAYTSYVLLRNLRGIQNLQDEMINGELDIF